MTKNTNVPTSVNNTPIVELFEAACERVYTSGNRIRPIALKKLNIDPIRINTPATISLVTLRLNDDTPF